MFHVLGFIIILVLLLVLIPLLAAGLWVLGKYYQIKQKVTGKSGSSPFERAQRAYSANNAGASSQSSAYQSASAPKHQGKIIPKDEGEYVNFEDV